MAALFSTIHFGIAVWILVDIPRWFKFQFDIPGIIYLWSAAVCTGLMGLDKLVLPFFQNTPIRDTLNGFFKKILPVRKFHAYLHSILSLLFTVMLGFVIVFEYSIFDNDDIGEWIIGLAITLSGTMIWKFFRKKRVESKVSL